MQAFSQRTDSVPFRVLSLEPTESSRHCSHKDLSFTLHPSVRVRVTEQNCVVLYTRQLPRWYIFIHLEARAGDNDASK